MLQIKKFYFNWHFLIFFFFFKISHMLIFFFKTYIHFLPLWIGHRLINLRKLKNRKLSGIFFKTYSIFLLKTINSWKTNIKYSVLK